MRVQVLVAAREDPPRRAGERAQRAHPLLASARPAAHEIARAVGRPSRDKPREIAPRTRAEHLDVDVGRRLGIRVRRDPRGLHAHGVPLAAQRFELVDDERLRQLRPLIEDEQQLHRAWLTLSGSIGADCNGAREILRAAGPIVHFPVSGIGGWR